MDEKWAARKPEAGSEMDPSPPECSQCTSLSVAECTGGRDSRPNKQCTTPPPLFILNCSPWDGVEKARLDNWYDLLNYERFIARPLQPSGLRA
jgi:hypothetical protein